MRTFCLVFCVALGVAVGMAFAVGLVVITTDHYEGRYLVNLTINTTMLPSFARPVNQLANEADRSSDELAAMKGTVTAVRPAKNEFVLSENVKNWTFQLVKDGQVYLNDREVSLSELRAGDEASVTFTRQGQQMLASMVRATRK